jgi:hypothetical protein
MASCFTCVRVCIALALLTPALAHAQGRDPESGVRVAAGGGFLTSSAYFTGPGSSEFANGDAFAGALQASVAVNRTLAVVVGGVYARPEWRLTGVPLLGSVGVRGGRLWFADVGLRAQIPLGGASRPAVVFGQAGAGLAHYALSASLLGTTVDERATNWALALGAGLALPLARRFGVELMAKDYIASFKSIRGLTAFGVEGRRAHAVVLVASGRFDL